MRAYHDDNLLKSSTHHQNGVVGVEEKDRRLSLSQPNLMVPGDRVSAMDRNKAVCSANYVPNIRAAIKPTVINYYYAVESSSELTTDDLEGRSMIRMLEEKLFRVIRPALLWCYFEEDPSTRRNLEFDGSSSLQGRVSFQLI